jgi:hypothetical protein
MEALVQQACQVCSAKMSGDYRFLLIAKGSFQKKSARFVAGPVAARGEGRKSEGASGHARGGGGIGGVERLSTSARCD